MRVHFKILSNNCEFATKLQSIMYQALNSHKVLLSHGNSDFFRLEECSNVSNFICLRLFSLPLVTNTKFHLVVWKF